MKWDEMTHQGHWVEIWCQSMWNCSEVHFNFSKGDPIHNVAKVKEENFPPQNQLQTM